MDPPKSSWLEDPWEWTVDQVVTAFCDPTQSFRATNKPQALPDAARLEEKLREHCIEGCGLLTDVNHASLREEFSILVLGQRGYLLREIQRLRRASRRYLEYIQNSLPEPSSGCCTTRHDTASVYSRASLPPKIIPSPSHAPVQSGPHVVGNNEDAFTPTPSLPHNEGLPRGGDLFQDSQRWVDQLPDPSDSFAVGGPAEISDESGDTAKPPEEIEVSRIPEPPQDKPKIAIDASESVSAATQLIQPEEPGHDQTPLPPNEVFIIDKNGKKRRRLVLTTVAPAESEVQLAPDTVEAKLCDEHPNQTPVEFDGAPTPTEAANVQDSKIEIAGTSNVTPRSEPLLSRQPCEAYLGTTALRLDDIFYDRDNSAPKLPGILAPHTIITDDDPGLDNFVFSGTSIANGRRQYIKSRIQHFLRQERQEFHCGNKKRLGILPYPDKLGRKNQPLSMSIFESSSKGIRVIRENRAKWLLHHPRRADSTEQNLFNVPISLKEDNGENWDYLEKWNFVSEHDLVFPLYGESGSEGEYDMDTWREMEKEKGTKLSRPLGPSKQMSKLSMKDVLQAIDDAIRTMTEDWERKRPPQLSRTAWLLWSKSRRNQTKQIQISTFDSDVQHYNDRLDKLRKEISNEKWASKARVTRQCESLRRTIYHLKESEWKIATLQLKVRPERPQKVPKAGSEKSQGFGSSIEAEAGQIDTSMLETSEGEDLDGFIVDDADSSLAHDDPEMMDAAEDDQVMIDGDSVTGIADDIEPDIEPKTVKRETSTKPTNQLLRQTNIVDLTLDSDGSESEAPHVTTTQTIDAATTPSVPLTSFDEDEDPTKRSQRKKALFKVPPSVTNVVDLDNDSAYDSPPERITPPKLPNLHEWVKISNMNPTLLIERADRKRLLIYILAQVDFVRRESAYRYICNNDLPSTQEATWRSIKSIQGYRSGVRGSQSEEEARTLKDITAWFVNWTNAVIVERKEGARKEYFEIAKADHEGFEPFYNYLHELRCLVNFDKPSNIVGAGAEKNELNRETTTLITQLKIETTPKKQKRALIEYSSDEIPQPSARKRKYAVPESQEAADLRKKAHERVQDREERQRTLKTALQRMGQTEDDPSRVAVNLGKLDNQELIYLPASIGEKIQPHQKDGVRFLWREIIEDHATKKGCLLAQTMGLGKTMQIITFLVTVAEAAKSSNANIRSQIPRRLRESKTLVLCPPSLIENWYEEFLLWAPNDIQESIGDVRKVSAALSPSERLQVIEEWGAEGGILLLGYSILKELIGNPGRGTSKQTPLDSDQHCMMEDILLGQPNIVIADEAHVAKNRNSKIHQILIRFNTGSRVALTGSPLSNNLSEYYALIEWVAPGYLGEHREFVAHYQEPIQEGLYRDSPAYKWRIGLKKLELFKREVQPKVHRADISILASRLKGKSEFVIKVPLTPLQEEIYQMFVDSMAAQYKDEGSQQARLWALISILRLVCNHPKCFRAKLISGKVANVKEKGKGGRKKQPSTLEEVGIADEAAALVDASPQELGMSANVIQRHLKPFTDIEERLRKEELNPEEYFDSVSLAYKMKLLLQIIEYSKAAGDKILVFSHSLLTLDYVGHILFKNGQKYTRLDGSVLTARRQQMTKTFNQGRVDVFLISTRAGGTGLNLFGANRVVILDDHFNPTWEEQAVGRAYRIGQVKHVFVYRLTTGGTFEEALHNQSLFKQQLATRAVDKRNIARLANQSSEYFRPLKPVERKDLKEFEGKDKEVLDKILAMQAKDQFICDIVPCETFQQEVEEKLTAEEQKEVEFEEEMSRLRRTDLAAYQTRMLQRQHEVLANPQSLPKSSQPQGPSVPLAQNDPTLPELPSKPGAHGGPSNPQPVNSNPPPVNSNSPILPARAPDQSKTAALFCKLIAKGGAKVSNNGPIMANGSQPPRVNSEQDPIPSLGYTSYLPNVMAESLPSTHPKSGSAPPLGFFKPSVPNTRRPSQQRVAEGTSYRAESEPSPSPTPKTLGNGIAVAGLSGGRYGMLIPKETRIRRSMGQ
ncbi:MAG: hypothetical protein Q9170_007059 [Blastenia crenularia]